VFKFHRSRNISALALRLNLPITAEFLSAPAADVTMIVHYSARSLSAVIGGRFAGRQMPIVTGNIIQTR